MSKNIKIHGVQNIKIQGDQIDIKIQGNQINLISNVTAQMKSGTRSFDLYNIRSMKLKA